MPVNHQNHITRHKVRTNFVLLSVENAFLNLWFAEFIALTSMAEQLQGTRDALQGSGKPFHAPSPGVHDQMWGFSRIMGDKKTSSYA